MALRTASPKYLRILSAGTFEGIAAALAAAAPWQERMDAAAKLIVSALHDVHPDKVDVVEWQVDTTAQHDGASIAYRVRD